MSYFRRNRALKFFLKLRFSTSRSITHSWFIPDIFIFDCVVYNLSELFPRLVLREFVSQEIEQKAAELAISCVYQLKYFEMNWRMKAFLSGGKNLGGVSFIRYYKG